MLYINSHVHANDIIHYSYIIWASWHLESLTTQLIVIHLTTKKTPKICISGPFLQSSTSYCTGGSIHHHHHHHHHHTHTYSQRASNMENVSMSWRPHVFPGNRLLNSLLERHMRVLLSGERLQRIEMPFQHCTAKSHWAYRIDLET